MLRGTCFENREASPAASLFRFILFILQPGQGEGNLPFLECRLLARRLLFPIATGILKMVTCKLVKGRIMPPKIDAHW